MFRVFLIFGVTHNENWVTLSYQFLPILMSPHVTRSQEKDPDTNFKGKWMKITQLVGRCLNDVDSKLSYVRPGLNIWLVLRANENP